MKASVTDPSVLSALNPVNVLAYLKSRGWQLYSQQDGRFSTWVNPLSSEAEVVVPASRRVSDYITLFAHALRELELFEERSQIDIIRDLMNSGFDVIRLSAEASSTYDGSIRIADGLRLFERAKDILLASACAAVKPRPVFHSRKPALATDYMEKAKFGQTEKGSFVITMLSPVTPHLPGYMDDVLGVDVPFERMVTQTLTTGLSGMATAADAASVAGGFEHFEKRVDQGVSANLCEATADLFSASEASQISFGVSWALNRPAPEHLPQSRVIISSDIVPVLVEAAKKFRAKDHLADYLVQGSVVKLERENGALNGRATVLAEIDGVPRRLTMELGPVEYDLAASAHTHYQPVRVIGDIRKEGRSYLLTKPTRFEIATDLDEFDLFG